MREYTVIYERGSNNWSAYVPDLPGCVNAGATREVAKYNTRDAIKLHLQGIREDGLDIPEPICVAGKLEVAA
ncbi:MAG: type II toxin-antitoxin system HicB family antitoxin [Armatimonadetes bacterium]|nr:type II toxin-antitoxin system HicB family antitoxin [Armatimonadota bacterium]MDE2207588.1 type II toxin-antitoxin system HicB family antitoxin [Armatimonadota bacterium]